MLLLTKRAGVVWYEKHEFVGLTLLDLFHDDHGEQAQEHGQPAIGGAA